MNIQAITARLLAAITPEWFLKYLSMLESELGAGYVTVINSLLMVLADKSPAKENVRIIAANKLSLFLGEENVAEAFVGLLVNDRGSNPFIDQKSEEGDLDRIVLGYLLQTHLRDSVIRALSVAAKNYSSPKLAAAAYRTACRIYSEKFRSTSGPVQIAAPDLDRELELEIDFEFKDPASDKPHERYLRAITYPLRDPNQGAEQFAFWALGALGELVGEGPILPIIIDLANDYRPRLRVAAAKALEPLADREDVQAALLEGMLSKQPSETYSIENPEQSGDARTYDETDLRKACIKGLAPQVSRNERLRRKLIDLLFCDAPGQYTDMLGTILGYCRFHTEEFTSLGEEFDQELLERVLQRNEPITEEGKLNLGLLITPLGLESCLKLLCSPNRSVQEIGIRLIRSAAHYLITEENLSRLIECAADCAPTLFAEVITTLGGAPGKHVDKCLAMLLTFEDSQARLAALRALVEKKSLPSNDEVDTLRSIASCDSSEEAELAVKLLRSWLIIKDVEELLTSIATNRKAPSAVRVAAVESLGRGAWGSHVTISHSGLKGLTAREHCISALVLDPDVKVRLAAISQLPKNDAPHCAELLRGTSKLVGRLLNCIEDSNVEFAVAVIGKLQPIASDENVAFALENAARNKDQDIAIAAMRALEQSGISPDLLYR